EIQISTVDNDKIGMKASIPIMSWLGIGFGSTMVGENIILFQAGNDSTAYKVTSYYSHYRATPTEVTSTTSLQTDAAEVNDTHFILTTTRKFDTGVAKEQKIT